MTGEPDWMNPANDRKTPYTDEELESFVDGFIAGFEEEWEDLKFITGSLCVLETVASKF